MEQPSRDAGLDCGRHVAALANKCHGGQDRAPQINCGEAESEHSSAAVANGDVQIVLVERMHLIGPNVKPHVVWLKTLIELNSYVISAHCCVPPFEPKGLAG